MECDNCRYFKAAVGPYGQCRRYPPRACLDQRFPVVRPDDWCGEWRTAHEVVFGSAGHRPEVPHA